MARILRDDVLQELLRQLRLVGFLEDRGRLDPDDALLQPFLGSGTVAMMFLWPCLRTAEVR
jgi:hypothetical protein